MGDDANKPSGVDYKATLNLPQTQFNMKANAPVREPEIQAFWESQNVYQHAMNTHKAHERFLLHDGPPYLSSDKIHTGHALNKTLKDIVTRYKTQRGFYSPYVPGFDGHGLPIENAVVKSLKGGRHSVSPFELRQLCREFAVKNLASQTKEFKRLGVWGNWEQPYATIDGLFEATQIRLFGQMFQKGFLYKGLKPVYWCTTCETALADAEVEYADHESHSIYVRFKALTLPAGLPDSLASRLDDIAYVIWTTTPWTLPANLGLAFNPDLDYVFIQTPQWGILVVAEALLESFSQATELGEFSIVHTLKGQAFEHVTAQHPFLADRISKGVLGQHVTTEAGTGIVHTAPGHGMDDYIVGQQYNLGIVSPLDNRGVFTAEAGAQFEGIHYTKGNLAVIDVLIDTKALIKQSHLQHSYPHCWRCQKPVIYRATEQWFISVDAIRQQALDEIKQVQWVPARGESRITSMVENRGDWCISRQRVWGVPIPVVYCNQCNHPILTEATINSIAAKFETDTSDAWWRDEADALLPAGTACPECQHTSFTKEMDIMDVWFDSGVTHTAVVEARSDELGNLPVELYLEGSDQHRGWFQSALLTSMMLRNKAPYKQVLTHGFILDQDGRKLSKSRGNGVAPDEVTQTLGADVLRLWVASVDYSNDVKIGKDMLAQLADIYRKIRNTMRFILGNLHGFDASTQLMPIDQLSPLDRFLLTRLNGVTRTLTEAFDDYQFHHYYQVLQNFCVTELSSLYFDVIKDTLYTAPLESPKRRAIQTVLYHLLTTLTPIIMPVMPHLAEDIWQTLPDEHRPDFGMGTPPVSMTLAPWPEPTPEWDANAQVMELLLEIKRLVNMTLEAPRNQKVISSPLETAITIIPANSDQLSQLQSLPDDFLPMLFITSSVTVESPGVAPHTADAVGHMTQNDITVVARRASGDKCGRCWKTLDSVGHHHAHPTLCTPCVEAVEGFSAMTRKA